MDSLGHDEYNKVGLSTPLWQAMSSSESALALTTDQTSFASEASEVASEDKVQRVLYALQGGFADVDWPELREQPMEKNSS